MTRGEADPPSAPASRDPVRHLGIVIRQDAPDLGGIVSKVAAAAEARGLTLSVEAHALAAAPVGTPSFDPIANPPDLVVALGGDGTLLRASRALFGTGIPLLGINLGNLGFLTAAGSREIESSLDRILSGAYSVDRRFTLRAVVHGPGDEEREVFHALNDMVVHKAGAARVARLEIRVGPKNREEEVGSFSGDGVIIATPTGSTAYNLSAGGPIVVPRMECLTVTPICPFTLAVRPLVVPSTEAVVVLALERDPSLVLTVDGQDGRWLQEDEWVRIARGGTPLHLVQFPERTFFGTLRRKLNWAARPSAEDGIDAM